MECELRVNRRGRPRIDRPKIDVGTPELIARRQAALGPRRKNPDGKTWWPEPNVQDAEHALGILLWRGEIDLTYDRAKRLYDAGIAFAGWWMLCNPKSFPGNTLRGLMPGSVTESNADEARACLTAASRSLLRDGRQTLDAIINCSVFQMVQPRKLVRVREGLTILMGWLDSPEARAIREAARDLRAA